MGGTRGQYQSNYDGSVKDDSNEMFRLAAEERSKMTDGYLDVANNFFDKRSETLDKNATAESNAGTASIIEQIRDGKTPKRTGLYNGLAVADAKYQYGKDQQALAFKRAAEARANSAEGRARAAHALRMKNGKSGGVTPAEAAYARALAEWQSNPTDKNLKTKADETYNLLNDRNAVKYSKTKGVAGKAYFDGVKKIADDEIFNKSLIYKEDPEVGPQSSVSSDLITPAIKKMAVNEPAVDSSMFPVDNTVATEELPQDDASLMAMASAAAQGNPILRENSFATSADNQYTQGNGSVVPGIVPGSNTTVPKGGSEPEINVSPERNAADQKVQQDVKREVADYDLDQMGQAASTSYHEYVKDVADINKKTIEDRKGLKSAKRELSHYLKILSKQPVKSEKSLKVAALVAAAENKVSQYKNEITNNIDNKDMLKTRRIADEKEQKEYFEDTQSREIRKIILNGRSAKSRSKSVREYVNTQQGLNTIPRDKQWKRDILNKLLDDNIGGKAFLKEKAEENPYEDNYLKGKRIDSTAGLFDEDFFNRFRDNSVDDVREITRQLLVDNKGDVNLKALQEAIVESDAYDRNDFLFGGDGEDDRSQGIDFGAGLNFFQDSEATWQTEVKENYAEIMSRKGDSGIRDLKNVQSLNKQLKEAQERIKDLEKMKNK